MKNGDVYVLQHWAVNDGNGTVSGDGWRVGPERGPAPAPGAVSVRIADVALFESNRVVTSPSLVGMVVVSAVSLGTTVFCLADTKACFGSCPTFYGPDGTGGERLMAEGFSDAVAPDLETTDIDALDRVRPSGRTLVLHMTNEALETHVVKQVTLLAAPRPATPGGRVVADADGALWQAPVLAAPFRCRAAEGDCLPAVRARDGIEWRSFSDGHDLAARETIDLEFPPQGGPLGVVLAVRQTLLSTYLFYQGLAWLGRDAVGWMAGRHSRARLRRVLGAIEVQVEEEGGGWRAAGEVYETGPLATDVHLVRFPADVRAAGRPLRVRLRLVRGGWRVDSVALATLGARVRPVRIAAHIRAAELGPRFAAGRTAATAFPIVTLPGDRYTLTFPLPDEPERIELFLETRGYYLEWMRREWLDEESPVKVALLEAAPALVFQMLAPAYRKVEREMETVFWSSRYAR